MRKLLIVATVALLLVATACGSDAARSPSAVESNTVAPGGSSPPNTAGAGVATITWRPLKGAKGVEEGTLAVPIDHADPTKGTFQLRLARHLASKPGERIGTMLVNPGGPGSAGTPFAIGATDNFDADLVDRFDILAWDPRGTGQSTPAIDCIDDSQYDHFFNTSDITPDTPAETQQGVDLVKELVGDCVSNNADILQHVGTNDSARDMDAIRAALGEQTITYFGFSYGSELGAVWATMFPSTVRTAVFDGASDPNADSTTSTIEQTKAFEASLDTFLQQCNVDAKCKFHNGGHADAAFDSLMSSIDEKLIPAEEGTVMLTRGAALIGVTLAMYDSKFWPTLAKALSQAAHGDGTQLYRLYEGYLHFNGEENILEALDVISCMDTADRPTLEQDDAVAAQLATIAPRLSPGRTGTNPCSFFPAPDDPVIAVTGEGAGPILVVGTTGDPATPLDSSRKMAAALEQGRLLVVDAQQHTGYHANPCASRTIDDYLIDPVKNLPVDGTECR
jgi:pimeloyl-ACP methyl ester carboxylesterase